MITEACACVFSKVLVQFAGVVLIKDESSSDAAAPTQAEEAGEQTSEGQESSEGGAKPTAEEKEAAEDGESLRAGNPDRWWEVLRVGVTVFYLTQCFISKVLTLMKLCCSLTSSFTRR